MQNAVLVGKLERARHGVEHLRALLAGEPAALHAGEQLREVEPVDVFHDDVRVRPVRLKVKDGHDVGVSQHARRARLREGLVSRRGCGVIEDGEPLDGNAALETQVPAGTHRAKAAGPPARENAVPA